MRSHRFANAEREGAEEWAREPGDLPPAESPQTLVERGWLMLVSRRLSKVLLLASLVSLAFVSLAHAAAPASVSVRVEGVNQTLLPPTIVTTNSTPVEKDGNSQHTCAGASAAGALEQATSGGWNGAWSESFHGYSVETILGETLAFEPGAPKNFFWAYWLDSKAASTGVCEGELSTGESILFFPECFSEEEPNPCPASPNPLAMTAPASAERGASVSVTVISYANASGTPSPAVGATVTGGGVSATTNASGQATLTLAQTGQVQLQATAADSVRTEATVCVHNGNDGTCGTTSPSGATTTAITTTKFVAPYKGPYAVVAHVTGLLEGHVYSRKNAPRVLRGAVTGHTQIASVSVKLRRSYRGRCFAFNGTQVRFDRSRCGGGSFFKVGATPNFSYLLPAALAPGRYVLDIEGTDAAGNTTSLARGSSRIVFYVR
jgi:hypothetical protein